MSGRTSLSTRTGTYSRLTRSMTCWLEYEVSSMTWHQWHQTAEIASRMGLSSALARSNASADHGCQWISSARLGRGEKWNSDSPSLTPLSVRATPAASRRGGSPIQASGYQLEVAWASWVPESDAVAGTRVASEPDDVDAAEHREIPVLSPDLGSVDKCSGGDPRVVHTRLPAGLELCRSQARVCGCDPFVGRQACGLLADAGERTEPRRSGFGIAGQQHTELQLGQCHDRYPDVLGQGPGELTVLLDCNENRSVEYRPSTHARSMTSPLTAFRSARSWSSAGDSRRIRSMAAPLVQRCGPRGTSSATGRRFTVTRTFSPASTRRNTSAVRLRRSREETSDMPRSYHVAYARSTGSSSNSGYHMAAFPSSPGSMVSGPGRQLWRFSREPPSPDFAGTPPTSPILPRLRGPTSPGRERPGRYTSRPPLPASRGSPPTSRGRVLFSCHIGFTGPWPLPISSECWIAPVTNSLASSKASCIWLPLARQAVIADENVQPLPWVLPVSMRLPGSHRTASPSQTTSSASSPAWPPLTTAARQPRPTRSRAARSRSSRLPIGRPSSTSASGRLGVLSAASGISRVRSASTASSRSSLAPPLATITGSTTRLAMPWSSMAAATTAMIPGLASMPVFAAEGARSRTTSSIWARIISTGSST